MISSTATAATVRLLITGTAAKRNTIPYYFIFYIFILEGRTTQFYILRIYYKRERSMFFALVYLFFSFFPSLLAGMGQLLWNDIRAYKLFCCSLDEIKLYWSTQVILLLVGWYERAWWDPGGGHGAPLYYIMCFSEAMINCRP